MNTIYVSVKKVNNAWPCEWDIEPIELRHDNDIVVWNLDGLLNEYKTATRFALKFTSGPSSPDVDPPSGGPFTAPSIEIEVPVSPPRPFELTATGRCSLWGSYSYDILVYYLNPEGTPLQTPIDPQIDNIAPPGSPSPLMWESESADESKERETVRTRSR